MGCETTQPYVYVGRFKERKDYLQIIFLKFLFWTIFKVLAESIFCFVGFFFGGGDSSRHVSSYLPQHGLKPHSLHWEARS